MSEDYVSESDMIEAATTPLSEGVTPPARRSPKEPAKDGEIDPYLLYHIRLQDQKWRERQKKTNGEGKD